MPAARRLPLLLVLLLTAFALPPRAVSAEGPVGMRTVETGIAYSQFHDRLKAAVAASPINVLFIACAHCGAKSLGITIPKNNVFHVFGPQFAVRMLEASVEAGFEAPLRLYTTERADGTAALTYRLPSAAFAPYGNPEIDAMARELDGIFERIVDTAVNG